MTLKIGAVALAAITWLASCSNSADKTTTGDTTISTDTTTTSYNPGDNTNVNVPATTRTEFEAKYPQATNVRWTYYRPDMSTIEWDWSGWSTVDTSDYVASFTWDGNDYWAWYDENGNWIGTVNRVADHAALPSAVNAMIQKDYNGYTIVSVDRETDKNRSAYEVKLEKGTDKLKLLVDENGKILKKKSVVDGEKTKEKTDK
jgi:Putative beta-lactamase-inhibitor-like, PepSY-like